MMSTLRVRLRHCMIAVGIGTLAFTAGAATTWHFSPTGCVAEDATSFGRLRYAAAKIWSTGGTANVVCPVNAPSSSAVSTTNASLAYMDTGSSSLSCTHYWTTSSGLEYWSWGFSSTGSSSEPRWFQVYAGPELQNLAKTWRCTLPNSASVFITGSDYTNF